MTTTPNGTTTPNTRSTTSGAGRPRIIIGLTLNHLTGKDPAAIATQHGLGHIPDTVLADHAQHAELLAALFDRNGEPLWLGRLERHATHTQYIALVLRDRGCVLCGADPTTCHTHHITPWNAPKRGRTDLDQLALLCPTCHTQLHTNNHTLQRNPTGHWHTRPATPNETPPQHHHKQHHRPGHDPPQE